MGRVAHFYFGKVSDKRKFLLQQAQEQHCLYQSKGRVNWLAHSDADEYFQIMTRHGNISDFLSIQSQFWYAGRTRAVNHTRELPCSLTCKDPGYFCCGRTKLILHPANVQYFSIHRLTTYKGKVVTPDPNHKLRLNHFKAVPNGTHEG